MASHMDEVLRISRASERLLAMQYPIKGALQLADSALEMAPELAPEVAEMKRRLEDLVEHVVSAGGVLTAQLGLLTDPT